MSDKPDNNHKNRPHNPGTFRSNWLPAHIFAFHNVAIRTLSWKPTQWFQPTEQCVKDTAY